MNFTLALLRFFIASVAGAALTSFLVVWMNTPSLSSGYPWSAALSLTLAMLPGMLACSPLIGAWALYFLGKPPVRLLPVARAGLALLTGLLLLIQISRVHHWQEQALVALFEAKADEAAALPTLRPGQFTLLDRGVRIKVGSVAEEGWYRQVELTTGDQTISAESLYISPRGNLGQIQTEARSGILQIDKRNGISQRLEFSRFKFFLPQPGSGLPNAGIIRKYLQEQPGTQNLTELWTKAATLQKQIDSLGALDPPQSLGPDRSTVVHLYSQMGENLEEQLARIRVEAAGRLALPFWVPGVGLIALLMMRGLRNLFGSWSGTLALLVSLALTELAVWLLWTVFGPMATGGHEKNSTFVVWLAPGLLGLIGLFCLFMARPSRQGTD